MKKATYNPYSAEIYREYRNDFLSPERFAEHLGKSLEYTLGTLREGKFSHNLEAAARRIPNAEKLQWESSEMPQVRVYFDGIHSKLYDVKDYLDEVVLIEVKQ